MYSNHLRYMGNIANVVEAKCIFGSVKKSHCNKLMVISLTLISRALYHLYKILGIFGAGLGLYSNTQSA